MAKVSELPGKLDAATLRAAAAAIGEAVNGPGDEVLDWHAVDWLAVESNVGRLRQRIFTASQAGDLAKVRNLQKLMLRSLANTLSSVRRVTEHNAGRLTPGVDGEVVVTPHGKAELAARTHCQKGPGHARPVRRVYVPKANGKQRPLGIPVIVDRVHQARVLNALEPEWEARFEPKSYGFRPGRGCQDAIAAIYLTLKGRNPQRRWVLDADLTAAFDRIDHEHLLGVLGGFPARGMIAGWLEAGVVEDGRFTPTREGTPQGGVISPLLLNVALHGLEAAAGVRYRKVGTHAAETVEGAPALVRYADDLVVMCHSRDQAAQVKERLAAWLAPRGLAFNEAKTRIVNVDSGFDFLGFNVRRYDDKLLIKPSKAALRRVRERLRGEMLALRGANALAVLRKINPIVRGWAAYYRTVVSSEAFTALDDYMWKLTYKWATHSHQNKPRSWVIDRYFGQFNQARRARWVFGDRETGAYLTKFAWTSIVRHQMVAGMSSPDDPALTSYWTARRRKGPPPPIGRPDLRLLQAQHGRCPLCGDFLLHADQQPQSPHEWEQWLKATRKALTRHHLVADREPATPDVLKARLVHAYCQRRHTRPGAHQHYCTPATPRSLLEPSAVKAARPVRRGWKDRAVQPRHDDALALRGLLAAGDPDGQVYEAWAVNRQEGLRDLYTLWGAPELARRWLNGLINECRAGKGPEVRGIARTLVQWREAILAWHITGYTNGPVEGLNSLIKKIKRVAAGFRSFANYRLRILLACGGCNWDLLGTPPR